MNKDEFDYEPLGVTTIRSGEVPDAYDIYNPDIREAADEHPCVELTKILSSGTFYYSVNFDLTNRLQSRYVSCGFLAISFSSKNSPDCLNVRPSTLTVLMKTFYGILIW